MENIYEKYSVEELTCSNIPNIVFVAQFLNILELSVDMKYWEKCADVLICRGHKKVKDIELLMLVWLQDLNWSGSIKILNYFVSLDVNELNEVFIDTFQLAYMKKDIEWAMNLWNILLNKKDGSIIEKNIRKNLELSKYIDEIIYEK